MKKQNGKTSKKRIESKDGEITVSKTVLRAGVPVDGEEYAGKLHIRPFATQTATIAIKKGFTKNLGNYQSVKCDVFVSVPCYIEEIVSVYKQVDALADDLINEQWDKAEEAANE